MTLVYEPNCPHGHGYRILANGEDVVLFSRPIDGKIVVHDVPFDVMTHKLNEEIARRAIQRIADELTKEQDQ